MSPHQPPSLFSLFPPTPSAALARIDAVSPSAYARSRNSLDGAVTRLSPYIVHQFVSLPEVLAGVGARHRLEVRHKFVFELGWREYFRHVWDHRREGILTSLHPGVLPEVAYAPALPADIREGRTGVPVIDRAVRELYATGYLHNHARMWLASYVIHLRKVHWRAGADWMVAHLLDGDLASNHLSWQWVAGTGSAKPYLFNADNVARHAPPAWHSDGTVVDASYEALDALARSPRPVPAAAPQGDGVAEPAPSSQPPAALAGRSPRASDVAGRDVWLVHPWALGELPSDLPDNCLPLAWWPADRHAQWPWSPVRWQFVGQRMATLAEAVWHGTTAEATKALSAARSVQTLDDPHVATWLPAGVRRREPLRLFPIVERPCPSFSNWWNRATHGLKRLADLPGLAALPATKSPTAPVA